jgi:hypothetical protein
MPLPVSKEISDNNPHLEIIYATDTNGQAGWYPRCNLLPDTSSKEPIDTSDRCQSVEGLKLRSEYVNLFLVFQEFLPHSPISCAECPTYRQHIEQKYFANSESNPGQPSQSIG